MSRSRPSRGTARRERQNEACPLTLPSTPEPSAHRLTDRLINSSATSGVAMSDRLSRTFAAFADPTRRAMLERLASGKASVSEIAEPFLGQMSLPAVTKHLKVLEQAGLVTKTRLAQRRLCELDPQGLDEARGCLERYRPLVEASLDRLGDYLATLASPQPDSTPAAARASASAPATAPTSATKKGSHGRRK